LSDLEEVDSRLFQIWGLRPTALQPQDLPEAARAIVGLYRKQAKVTLGTTKEISYVLITAPGVKAQILASDWAKIEPFIKDGSLDPLVVPSVQNTVFRDPNVAHDLTLLSPTDPYYVRVLGILQTLFPAT